MENKTKLQIYALLHLKEGVSSAENLKVKSFKEQISVYVNMAIALSKSLSLQGIQFALLTNKADVLNEILKDLNQTLVIKEIACATKVPESVKFHSAHHKLDAFRYMSSVDEGYVALCDIDALCINQIPQCFLNIIDLGIPVSYDISDQVMPVYGHDVIIKDIERIHEQKSEGRWYGGEFIGGKPSFFKQLVEEVDSIYDKYIENISTFHHTSDETFVTVALENMRYKGLNVGDAGTLGIIGRYWNWQCRHEQKSLKYFLDGFLLHVPSDKKFLADLADKDISDYKEYQKRYTYYVRFNLKRRFRKMIPLKIIDTLAKVKRKLKG